MLKLTFWSWIGVLILLSSLIIPNYQNNKSMQKTRVIEVVIYEVVPEQVHNTELIIADVNQVVKDFEGFISRKVYQSPEDSTIFMDFVEWESLEEAKNAAKQIANVKALTPFMQSIKSIKIMNHFEAKQF